MTMTSDTVQILDNDYEESQQTETTKKIVACHPDSICMKLIALILMCTLGFGSYFCYDNPGALQNEIKTSMDISTYQFDQIMKWSYHNLKKLDNLIWPGGGRFAKKTCDLG